MEDRELINKIRELKQIKPNQDWVVFSKNQILGQEDFVTDESKNLSIVSVFQALFRKPAYATITVVLLLAVSIASFFILTDKERPVQVKETPEKVVYEPEPEKEIILALEDLQKEIEQATEGLKEIEEPQKVLEARNTIIPTIEAVREIIVEVEKLEQGIETETKQDRILVVKTSIDKLATSVDGLESTLDEAFAIQAKNLIQYLETRTLTEVQQKILEKAKESYDEGNYDIALINAIFVSQLRER